MKTMFLNLWAWIVSDPAYAIAAALVVLVMVWKALPTSLRVSIETRFPRAVGIVRTIVALVPDLIGAARVVRYQAVGGQPRVVVSDRAAAESDKLRELLKPEESKPSEPGFAERGVIAVIAGVALLALGVSLLSGCPRMPAAEGCASGAVRCSERGVPQLCDSQGRWTPMDDQCSAHEAQCCVTSAYSSRTIAVCLPMTEACHAAQ